MERSTSALVKLHYTFVWRTLRRFGLSSADADDAAQQVFLVLDRKLQEITPGRERSFLFGTAMRVASRARRSVVRRREVDGEINFDEISNAEPSPHEALERRRAADLMNDVLETMPDEVRAVFILYEIEQLTMAEISTLIEVPPGTVASRLRRGRELFDKGVARLKARANQERGAS